MIAFPPLHCAGTLLTGHFSDLTPQDTAKQMFALFAAAPGVETAGMFAITETTQDFWWPYLQNWLSGA